jgi:hypothetical protein
LLASLLLIAQNPARVAAHPLNCELNRERFDAPKSRDSVIRAASLDYFYCAPSSSLLLSASFCSN